jgi:hypothetical protein
MEEVNKILQLLKSSPAEEYIEIYSQFIPAIF